jgi:DNA-directed RNA polymerase subunit M/transcription elongation factor TFIIS
METERIEFKCRKCAFICYRLRDLEVHRHKLHLRLYCETCDKVFQTQERLDSHIAVHKFSDGLLCKLCFAEFGNFTALSIHLTKAHYKEMKQEESKLMFSNAVLRLFKFCLLTDLLQFDCEVCGKSFSRRDNLRNHMLSHNKAHLKAKHIKEGRKFKCDQCNYAGKTKQHLYYHKKSHTGRFHCSICNKTYRTNSGYKRHAEIHQRLICDRCGSVFASRYQLHSHLLDQIRTKNLICEQNRSPVLMLKRCDDLIY